ncbi:MAG TPA: isopentenyl-diphosphate Delta-isomerase [Dehalococcoidales bacterium]|nr:isopentenyl-diphosphate Delta-isomerase [Dehalococcoidales bacterium]
MNGEEQVILVDSLGQPLVKDGQIVSLPKLEVHQKGLRHLAVSVFIFDSQNRLLLQRRAQVKYHSPGKWSNTCCTHPLPGETPIQAARRRLQEEMGLIVDIKEIFTFSYRADVGGGLIENEFDHVFWGQSEGAPSINPDEVLEWRRISLPELDEEMAQHQSDYTIWFLLLWSEVKKYLLSGKV